MKNEVMTEDKTVPISDENLLAAASGETGPPASATPMLDPSVVPEGEGMVDG